MFDKKKVVVYGDIIIDEFVKCKTLGISAETPTMVLEELEEYSTLGGAALVARNLLRLGCEVIILHPLGYNLNITNNLRRDITEEENANLYYCSHILDPMNDFNDKFIIPRKRRYFVNDYKILQTDLLNHKNVDEKFKDSLVEELNSLFSRYGYEALVLCDNRHGAFDEDLAKRLIDTAYFYGATTYVDSQNARGTKDNRLQMFKNADYFLVNEKELEAFVGPCMVTVNDKLNLPTKECRQLVEAENRLKGRVVLKRGDLGSMHTILTKTGVPSFVNTQVPEEEWVKVKDVTGAGDAFLAAFVASNHNTIVANEWASMSVELEGTNIPSDMHAKFFIDEYKNRKTEMKYYVE